MELRRVSYILSDEQDLLKDQFGSLLTELVTPEALRQIIDDRRTSSSQLWAQMAELGFLSASIPEPYGGAGLGPCEAAVMLEEMGKHVAPVPYFPSICGTAEAIMLAGSEDQKTYWLPKLASGEVIGTFAFSEGRSSLDPGSMTTVLAGTELSGSKMPVPEASSATLCVVATSGGGLSLVRMEQPQISVTPLTGFDELLSHSQVTFDRAAAEPLAGADRDDMLSPLLDRMAIYQSFQQIGGARAALEMARDFSLQRFIFGRPLASYQATKHKLAEILIKLELARALAMHAVSELASGADSIGKSAAAARIAATQAYEEAARENLQIHGGIGFTWEANVHFHLRRSRLLALDLGSIEYWSKRLIAALSADLDRYDACDNMEGSTDGQ